jgi:RNA polymerase sigma-70 factor (ECF subfamily)
VVFAQRQRRPEPVAFLPSAFADDGSLVEQLRAGNRAAVAALFDRYAEVVERVLVRVLGVDPEIPDLLQDVFMHALLGADRYRGDASSLQAWVTRIAVKRAQKCIRRRTTRRWLGLSHPIAVPEPVGTSDPEMQATLARAYAVLERMPMRERVPFALRFLEGMALAEVAEACELSLATTKRRLVRARERFTALAVRDSILCDWIEEAHR